MPSKKRILNAINEHTKTLKRAYYKRIKLSKLLTSEAKENCLNQEKIINNEFDEKIKKIKKEMEQHQEEIDLELEKKRKGSKLLTSEAKKRRLYQEKIINIELDEKIKKTRKEMEQHQEEIDLELEREKKFVEQTIAQQKSHEQSHKQSIDAINTSISELSKSLGWSKLDFMDERWKNYRPVQGDRIPELIRIGELSAASHNRLATFPALLSIIGKQHVFIKASGKAKESAAEAMQVLMLRLLAALPAGKLKFIFIDPVGLGSNMAGFMYLPKELIGGKIWTEANHIEQRLADLSEHMEMVIQKYLKNRYSNMEEYNKKAGEVAEPYRILAIANFPANFTESSARRLINIATNGPRTGVHIILTIDKDRPLPYGFKLSELDELERTGVLIDSDGNEFMWRNADFPNCSLRFDRLPPTQRFNDIVISVAEKSKDSKKVEVPFERIISEPEKWWSNDSRTGLVVPIGKIGADELLSFDLGKSTAQHTLIAGKTGSGKSNLLHVVIMGLSLRYSPQEIELYLIDFKKGIEFKDYATYVLPHAKVIAIQSEREFGVSVLQGLDKEMQRRGDLFREKGVSSIQQYRERFQNEKMSRILLLVDEYQEFFSQEDPYSDTASLILKRLVSQGRAFGMHILLASQTIASSYNVSRSTTDQMAVRIALQCSDTDSRLVLGDENPAARLLSRPGEAIYNSENGSIEGNILFQVFLLSDESRVALLRKIQQKLNDSKIKMTESPIVFEGDAPAEFENNREFVSLVDSKDWPKQIKSVQAWLGEPIAIKSHTCALFRRQSRSNLLIIGQKEETSVSLLATALVSLASQQKPAESSFYIVNLSVVDSDWHNLPTQIAGVFPHEIKIAKRRDTGSCIERVANSIRQRIENIDKPASTSIYLIIIGLNRARDLRSKDGYTPQPTAEDLAFILREGPDVGVHTLMWCDTIANFKSVFGEEGISEFDLRIALQMSSDDSSALIESDSANKLQAHRAIFYDEEKTGILEKFRPYARPEFKFIKDVGKMLSSK